MKKQSKISEIRKHYGILLSAAGVAIAIAGLTLITPEKNLQDTQTSRPSQEQIKESTKEDQIAQATASQTQPTATAPTPSPAPQPKSQVTVTKPTTAARPSPQPAKLIVSALELTSSTVNGVCAITMNTTLKSNFNGGVTVNFTVQNIMTNKTDNLSKTVYLSSGVITPFTKDATFIDPGVYEVIVMMNAGNFSLPTGYSYPSVDYTGTQSGRMFCHNT